MPTSNFPASGVPPHIAICTELLGFKQYLEKITSILEKNPEATVFTILEQNGYETRPVTPSELNRMRLTLGSDMEERMAAILDGIQNIFDGQNAANTTETTATPTGIYNWGGQQHSLPENYK